MAHENNVTNFFIDSKGNKVWYNEVGKLHEGPRNKYHAKKQNPSAHQMYKKTLNTLINHATKRPNRGK